MWASINHTNEAVPQANSSVLETCRRCHLLKLRLRSHRGEPGGVEVPADPRWHWELELAVMELLDVWPAALGCRDLLNTNNLNR